RPRRARLYDAARAGRDQEHCPRRRTAIGRPRLALTVTARTLPHFATAKIKTSTAHGVAARNDLPSFGIDVLLFQSVARFPVDPIETYLFAHGRGRVKRNGA